MKIFDDLLQGKFPCGFRYEFWPSLDPSARKLLVVLHGQGESPGDFHFLPTALDLDALHTLFLEAPDRGADGFSPRDLAKNRGILFELFDSLSNAGIATRDVFLFGFSQGGMLGLDVALRYPKVLGGIVDVSGAVGFENEYPLAFSPVAARQRIWISHGYGDRVLAFEKTEASILRLRGLGISVEWVPIDKGHCVDEAEELKLAAAFLRTQLECN